MTCGMAICFSCKIQHFEGVKKLASLGRTEFLHFTILSSHSCGEVYHHTGHADKHMGHHLGSDTILLSFFLSLFIYSPHGLVQGTSGAFYQDG